MSHPIAPSCWDIVEAIIKERGRTLSKYRFFEELWSNLENDKHLIFLQAPTGAGKTEAVLAPFLHGLICGERSWHSLLYVLPTRSLVHNMFKRFCKALMACKNDFGKPKHVVVDYDYGGFLPFKPFVEGDITVTTYDTLVYTFYGFRSYGHHLFLSIGKIAGSLVVLDEVQLLQDNNWYALSLLPHHIINLLSFGATVVVMSATIPRILIEETVYPITAFRAPEKRGIEYEIVKADPTKDNISRGKLEVLLKEGFLQGSLLDIVETYEKPMLLVFNTVERAANAYNELRKGGHSNLVLLHSRLINAVRKERESLFEEGGKESSKPNDEGLIVIATQVVEAGVDFDFRTVATEICPIDSLIQRLGRCARKANGHAIVFKEAEQAEWVYPKAVIEQTLKVVDEQKLAESVRDVRVATELVNNVYTKEVVERLKSEVSDDISSALAFIKTFGSDKIWSKKEVVANHQQRLLRLGLELRCLLLPQELYQKILSHCEGRTEDKDYSVEIEECPPKSVFELLINNTFSLSVSLKEVGKRLEIPSLKHKIGEGEYYLSLSIGFKESKKSPREDALGSYPEERSYEVPRAFLRIKMMSELSRMLRQYTGSAGFVDLLIVNPSYYEISDGYHLGLVRPCGKGQ